LAIYKAIELFYDEIAIEGDIRYPRVAKLPFATAEARFLFPKEIEKHVEVLHKKAFTAAGLRERL